MSRRCVKVLALVNRERDDPLEAVSPGCLNSLEFSGDRDRRSGQGRKLLAYWARTYKTTSTSGELVEQRKPSVAFAIQVTVAFRADPNAEISARMGLV